MTWAEIGAKVGQRNLSVTADRYTHAMMDYTEIDRAKLLKRVRSEVGLGPESPEREVKRLHLMLTPSTRLKDVLSEASYVRGSKLD